MKRFAMTLIATVAFSMAVFAQAPEGINYQAIARDGNGSALTNQNLDIRFSIREGNPGGTVVYEETHASATNDFGLFTLLIGEGNPQTGTFDAIAWGSNTYFLQVEADAGNGYVDLGTTQMMSVPYALYAKEAGNAGKDYTAGNGIDITGTTISNTGDLDPTDDIVKGDAAGGDLAGSYPDPMVTAIQGKPVSTDVPAAGQVLKWDGAQWKPEADNTGGGGNSVWNLQGNDAYYTNGNVGIGTNFPNRALDVEGKVQISNSGHAFDLGINSVGQFEVLPNGDSTAAITVDDDQNHVGFFGSTPVTANTVFDVHSDAAGTSYGGMFVNTDAATAKPFYGYATSGGAKAWTYYDGTTEQLRVNNAGDHMVVTKDGYVGIGTTIPSAPLQVQGDFRLSNGSDIFDIQLNGDGQMEFQANGFSSPSITVDDDKEYVGLFGNTPVTANSGFDIHSPATGTNYGGMFVNTASTDAKPFYGYATSGSAKAWTYYDGATGNWQLYNTGKSMTFTNQGILGIGTASPDAQGIHVRSTTGNLQGPVALIESTHPSASGTLLSVKAEDGVPGHTKAFQVTKGFVGTSSIDLNGSARFSTVRVATTTSLPEENTMYANSLPMGYGNVNSNGTMGGSKYNLKSVTKTGTGTYDITIHTNLAQTPAVMVTPYDANGGEIANFRYDSNTQTIEVIITDQNGNKTDSNFSIMIFGRKF